MAREVTDIVIGPARAFYGPVGTALPADTVGAGEAWPAGWLRTGYTLAPLTLAYEYETKDIEIEESLAPVGRRKTKENLTVETTLAELDLAQLALAWGGTVTDVAAGTGQPGKAEMTVGGVAPLRALAWGFEGSYVDQAGNTFPIRVFIWQATGTAGAGLEFGKENPTGTTLKLAALADLSRPVGEQLCKVQKIVAAAAA